MSSSRLFPQHGLQIYSKVQSTIDSGQFPLLSLCYFAFFSTMEVVINYFYCIAQPIYLGLFAFHIYLTFTVLFYLSVKTRVFDAEKLLWKSRNRSSYQRPSVIRAYILLRKQYKSMDPSSMGNGYCIFSHLPTLSSSVILVQVWMVFIHHPMFKLQSVVVIACNMVCDMHSASTVFFRHSPGSSRGEYCSQQRD